MGFTNSQDNFTSVDVQPVSVVEGGGLTKLKALSVWNWKSAFLSMILRVPVFAIATVRRGPEVMGEAVLAEMVVCAIYAGFYAGLVQMLRNRKPVWLVATIVAVVFPAAGQVLEYAIHTWHGTPHRVAAVIVSSIFSAIASLFNWYAMKHGTLLVGNERSEFATDLRRMPSLLLRFFLLGPRWVGRRLRWIAVPN